MYKVEAGERNKVNWGTREMRIPYIYWSKKNHTWVIKFELNMKYYDKMVYKQNRTHTNIVR